MKTGFDMTGVKTVRDMAEAFTGVWEACNLVFTSNQQISFNIKQQAIAIQQVGDAMNSLNQAAFQTVSGITQVKIGTQKPEAALNFKSVVSEVCSETRGVRDLMDLMDLMKNWAHFSFAFTVRASPLAICTIREILNSHYDKKMLFAKLRCSRRISDYQLAITN
ncbi:hypothetical protein [Tychonema sp. LEGE 06208]|nr:hypothetical protein [Tychonema sp. LEGE 06208]MBE9161822.1 hypothetical protein [Tychonema sp. LEGE 06208]